MRIVVATDSFKGTLTASPINFGYTPPVNLNALKTYALRLLFLKITSAECNILNCAKMATPLVLAWLNRRLNNSKLALLVLACAGAVMGLKIYYPSVPPFSAITLMIFGLKFMLLSLIDPNTQMHPRQWSRCL